MSQVCDVCGGKDGEHFLNNGNLTSGKGHIHYQNINRQSIELPCDECGGIGIYHFPGCSELEENPDTRKVVDDPVNHPSHYTAYSGLEVIDLTEQMNFCRGNAVKYICRAGKKSKETEVQDCLLYTSPSPRDS